MFPGEYRLYGVPRSFFTAKLENILRYLGVPYARVQKFPHDGSEIEQRGGSGAVPLLQTPEDWVLSDSTPISQFLDGRFPNAHMIPPTPVQRVAMLLLEDWIDEWFTRAAMYTRWNFQESVDAVFGGEIAAQMFGKSWFELTDNERQKVIPLMQEMKPRHEQMMRAGEELLAASVKNGEDILVWFGAFLDNLASHLEHHRFFFGNRPSVADFSISGGFSAHFAYDPYPRRFVEGRQPVALEYAERCWNAKINESGFYADDQLPTTLRPLFEQAAEQYGRYLVSNRDALQSGETRVGIDLGFGPRKLVASPYREVCRVDIRQEVLALSSDDQARLSGTVPDALLEAYTLLPLDPPITVPRTKGLASALN